MCYLHWCLVVSVTNILPHPPTVRQVLFPQAAASMLEPLRYLGTAVAWPTGVPSVFLPAFHLALLPATAFPGWLAPDTAPSCNLELLASKNKSKQHQGLGAPSSTKADKWALCRDEATPPGLLWRDNSSCVWRAQTLRAGKSPRMHETQSLRCWKFALAFN